MTKVKLGSSDSQVFEVEEEVANESQTIKGLLEDAVDRSELIPLPNVSGRILSKVIEFTKYHAEACKKGSDGKPAKTEEEVLTWDTEFMKVDQATMFDIILAANYLNIKGLLDLTCKTVAAMIKGKTPEELRKQFNIKNDFTPEEQEEVMRENQWSFD